VGGDWYNAYPVRVQPGDVILVHAGLYKDKRFQYAHEGAGAQRECCSTTGDGTYYLTAKGTPDKPIVIKAAGDGEVIFDGDGNYNLFNVMAADYNYFEGITFRNTLMVFEAGIKNITGVQGLTVKNSKFYDIGIGVHTDWSGSKNFYITDNDFTGRHDPEMIHGFEAQLLSQFAVKVYGSGHVIAYNRVKNFHDGIDHATYGRPDGWPDTPRDRLPVSIDIYNNDISNMHDNCVEVDGVAQNVRVMRNRCANANAQAYSMQPLLGGPAYFIRNIAYNSGGAIKYSETPAGGIFYHNTFLTSYAPGAGGGLVPLPGARAGGPAQSAGDAGEGGGRGARPDGNGLIEGNSGFGSNMHLRNNLILRQASQQAVFHMQAFTNYSSSDYNGFDPGSGGTPFGWSSPPFNVQKDRRVQMRFFRTLTELEQEAHQDQHSILVDSSVFERVTPVEMRPPRKVLDVSVVDVRLKAGSLPIDKGVALPNVNDGFSGAAPDLGAIEFGAQPPHYGPRTAAVQPTTTSR